MHPHLIKLMVFGLLFLATGNLKAEGGEISAGEIKSYTCKGCHGIPGYSNVYPTYKVPKVGGQNYEYLVSALKAYRAGERNHPTMALQADSLTDQDIEDISAFFASFGHDS
jgi:cytochrome c553